MSKKELFKKFVSSNPSLINNVSSGNTSWQKLFEIYDLYGEDNEVWKKYIQKNNNNVRSNSMGIKDVLNNIKGMNMDNVQKNISSLQKAVEFLTDITATSKTTSTTQKTFKERPINKFFDD